MRRRVEGTHHRVHAMFTTLVRELNGGSSWRQLDAGRVDGDALVVGGELKILV